MSKLANIGELQLLPKEIFEEIEIDDELKLRYAISNYGRLVSFRDRIKYGRVLKGSITDGFRIFRYKIRRRKKTLYRHRFFYKLVAECFLEKPSEEQTCLLHLDHNLSNDHVSNLKWATKQEMLDHQQTNPKVLKTRKISGKRKQTDKHTSDAYQKVTC